MVGCTHPTVCDLPFDKKKILCYTLYMGKIDEVKEILNTLRVAMSIGFGIFVLIVGKLVSLYSDGNFSEIFWMSIAASLLDMLAILLILPHQLNTQTFERTRRGEM